MQLTKFPIFNVCSFTTLLFDDNGLRRVSFRAYVEQFHIGAVTRTPVFHGKAVAFVCRTLSEAEQHVLRPGVIPFSQSALRQIAIWSRNVSTPDTRTI